MGGVLREPRFTHITLPVNDLNVSIEWYERYTPLRCIDQRRDVGSDVAWMCDPDPTDHPFVLALVSLDSTKGAPQGQLGPYGHLGIELAGRDAVDAMAVLGRFDGCLAWEPNTRPDPLGYVCALSDPDGNVVEFSYDHGVHDTIRQMLVDRAARAEALAAEIAAGNAPSASPTPG